MNIQKQAPTGKEIMSEGSNKRRRSNSPDTLEKFPTSSGQLSLFDVWGIGKSIPNQGWKIGAKYRKQLELKTRQDKSFNYQNRNNTYHWNRNDFNNNNVNHQPEQELISGKTEEASSIGSKTNSNISLFSLHSSSSQSDISDGFNDVDFEFDPKLFVLEVNPKYGLHPSWLEQLKPILMQPEIISLHQQLGPVHLGYDYKAGQQPVSLLTQVFPHPQQLYNWSRLTPLEQVKVVIIGSRPSQSPGQSHGLAFSQPVHCQRLSGPIESIHRELSIEYPNEFIKPNHGSLVSWAKSGVLLLNEVQTSQRDHPNAHSKFGWSQFTIKILEVVSQFGGSMYSFNTTTTHPIISETHSQSSTVLGKGIVFIAWGEQALQLIKTAGIYYSDRNHKVLSCKGSPYANSAHDDGFFNNQHFVSSNQHLSSIYGPEIEIDWCNLEPVDPPS